MPRPNPVLSKDPGDNISLGHVPPKDSSSTIDTPFTDPLEKSIDIENQINDKDNSASDPPHNLTRTRVFLLLIGLAMCIFLSSMDISIIATALPRISSDFSAQSQMSWVATAYLIAYNTFNPCDMFTDVVERARYQSVFWASFAISSIVGPLIGGVFVEHATWRWCFWINLPLGGLAFAAIVVFHQLPFQPSALKEQLRRVDYLGVFFIMATVTCLLLPLSTGGTMFAWNSAAIISMFCVFVVLLGLLILVEFRATEAIIPPALFKNRDIVILYVVNCVVGMIFMGCTFYVPLYFQVVQGTSATVSGVRLMPNVIGVCISTTLSSFALKWIKDFRLHICTGLAIMTVAVGLLILFDVETGIGQQIVTIFLMGFGNGLIFQNVIIAAQLAASKEDMAVATALSQFANSMGNAIGVAVCAAVLNNALARSLAKLPAEMQGVIAELDVINNVNAVPLLPEDVKSLVIRAYADGFQFLFKVLTPIVGVTLLLSLFLRKGK
ncbi:MAG: major facilitator superfamily domain-containing protein [Podila humilis]|nr:MAG: major facilitator superfamily domain-containing protein [Podila humilis]